MKLEDHVDPDLLAGDLDRELALVKACLRGYFDPPAKPIREAFEGISERSFFEILRLNKVARIAAVTLARDRNRAEGEYLREAFETYRRRTLSLNLASLSAGFEAAEALEAAAIPFALMKGPAQQKLLYSDAFIKPAGDVDILVAPSDFASARTALGRVGYAVSSQSRSSWWWRFLGEQHMTAPSKPDAATLDLHYRLQQPGSPSPAGTVGFLARRQRVAISGRTVDFMSAMDILLVSSMSVVKALFNREPSAGYVCDVRAAAANLSGRPAAALLAQAEAAGLLETLLFGLRAADLLLGPVGGELFERSRGAMPRVPDADLAGMILAPWLACLKWPQRRHILWDLCGHDPWRYAREGAWLVAAEIGRRLAETPH